MKTAISLALFLCTSSFTTHAMLTKIEENNNRTLPCTPSKKVVGQYKPVLVRKDIDKQKTLNRAQERKNKHNLDRS